MEFAGRLGRGFHEEAKERLNPAIMSPILNIVVSRSCTADDIRILRRFRCCAEDGSSHEWEIEPQRHITGLAQSDFDNNVDRLILTTEMSEEVFAFAEYGHVEEADSYAIAWIARSFKCKGKRLGGALLDIVLDLIGINAYNTGRNPVIFTQIDPRNSQSRRLFAEAGFSDGGKDPSDPGFNIWLRKIEPHAQQMVRYDFATSDLLHYSRSAD
ncbi:MAG: hypothetical protein LKF99_03005 [Bifidobacterium sp.]|jgi:hypothetical protein|nr:hypothetical protein [Bifidobacterium sp.]